MDRNDISKIDLFYHDFEDLIKNDQKLESKASKNGTTKKAQLRTLEDAIFTLHSIKEIHKLSFTYQQKYSSLYKIFVLEWGDLAPFTDAQHLEFLIFTSKYIFPKKKKCLLELEGEFSSEYVKSHTELVDGWWLEAIKNHSLNKEKIKEFEYRPHVQFKHECPCLDCAGSYRAKLKDALLVYCKDLITDKKERLEKHLTNFKMDSLSKEVSRLVYQFESCIKTSSRFINKHSVKRKLENDINDYFNENFGYESEIGFYYTELLRVIFQDYFIQKKIDSSLVSDEQYKKFFQQLKRKIWRSQDFILREFDRLVQSLLLLKRTDVTSKILQEYIGNFWLYSKARKLKRKIIYHMGPTNSGKTYNAIKQLAMAKNGSYLAPLRLLATELYDTLNSMGTPTTLLTGEEVIENEGATHYSSTIEMAQLGSEFECAVIDEIQMLSDPQRGWAWTRALINIQAKEVHICGDHTVLEKVKAIVELTDDTLETREYERMTKLEVLPKSISTENLEKGDALIVFSRRNALRFKSDLENHGYKVSVIYGRLGPEVRREQARKFDSGETDILVSTDAISMGMNLPIKRIIFSTLSKFIDSQEHPITHSEIKQIAGRAGRFNRFPTGYVASLNSVPTGILKIEQALNTTLRQKQNVMLGADFDLFQLVNKNLSDHELPNLKLSEFLQIFNNMVFTRPFTCVDLSEMIELAETVEQIDKRERALNPAETFGFCCAPVNFGLQDHIEYYVSIVTDFVNNKTINFSPINHESNSIDYLETAIKCIELFQWLARHFKGNKFEFDEDALAQNKILSIEKLNSLLSEKIVRTCSSCGKKISQNSPFAICEPCFKSRRQGYQSKSNNNFKGNPNSHGKKYSGSGQRGTRKKKT